MKIHPFFCGHFVACLLCVGLDGPVWYAIGWWGGRTGGADGVPWDWRSHGEA